MALSVDEGSRAVNPVGHTSESNKSPEVNYWSDGLYEKSLAIS